MKRAMQFNDSIDMVLMRHELESLKTELSKRDVLIRQLESQLSEMTDEIIRIREEREILSSNFDKLPSNDRELWLTLVKIREELLSRCDEIEDTIYNFKTALEQSVQTEPKILSISDQNAAPNNVIPYRQLVNNIRECACTVISPSAKVLVISKGDKELLKLDGREGWHFPQREDGVYAGFYPAESSAAISHLESLRAKGASYLLIPNTAFWWLDHYSEFRQHLENQYQVAYQDENCLIFALGRLESNNKQLMKADKSSSYRLLIKRVREIVQAVLPTEAVVIVVTKGDDDLLQLGNREAWHFPQKENGVYAGFYPLDSDEAIAHLEELRARGAEYIIFPETSFWWLQHYEKFNQHLETHCRLVVRQKYTCLIYKL